jgi:hypothetical protein
MKPVYAGESPPTKANATVAGGVRGQAEILTQANHNEASDWRQGLSAHQLRAVADHRRSRPFEPLPPALQRDLGRSWRQYVARLK